MLVNVFCLANVIISFVLLDKPEGVAQNGPLYVLSGRDITIVGFVDIDSNPEVSSSVWSTNGNLISNTDRFNVSVTGQLKISSVTVEDTGNFTNMLINSVGEIENTIELKVVGMGQFICA